MGSLPTAEVAHSATVGDDFDPTYARLQDAAVPVSDAPCRACADPCDEGHEEYPKLDIDVESPLLGLVKPHGRQVVISTGKTDWAREVTEAEGSLAAYLSRLSNSEDGHDSEEKKKAKADDGKRLLRAGESAAAAAAVSTSPSVSGIHVSDHAHQHKNTMIMNGSHRTICEDDTKETVLVFPDYKVVMQVDRSQQGAEALWKSVVGPDVRMRSLPRVRPLTNGDSALSPKSWIIPYSCVILLCSHKRRDNRCAVVSPKLQRALTGALEYEGWEVHHQLEDPSLSGPALEDDPSFVHSQAADGKTTQSEADDADAELLRRYQQVDAAQAEPKRALILFCSHIGQHKFAGNLIINTPRGASIWYARVTPHEVETIVKETIIGGKILPALLRGGLNLCYPGRRTLNEW